MRAARAESQSVTVGEWIEAGRDRLDLELLAGEAGLNRPIREAAINRPGLALTGFYQYFAHRRVQVLGHAETAYLASLSDEERAARFEAVLKAKIPCLVLARNRKADAQLKQLADAYKIPVLRTRLITREAINAATILLEDLLAPRVRIPGTMVEVTGIGVLILGRAGTGKSEAALSLLQRGHSLVADQVTEFHVNSSRQVIGTSVEMTRYHMELRGLGIIHVPSLFGVASVRVSKRLDLVVMLRPHKEVSDVQLATGDGTTKEICGCAVPLVSLPVAAGRDMANLVEVAALDHKLKCLGHDAMKELDTKLLMAMGSADGGE